MDGTNPEEAVMADTLETTYRPVLEAIAFAARAHRGQLRKDNQTPYASHVFRVCFIVRHVFGLDDPQVLAAAVLHDTVEDTTVDFDDLQEQFGEAVAVWVGALSKDKRKPEEVREQAYTHQLRQAAWQVKVCKLADVFDNLMDTVHLAPKQRARTFQNAHRYLEALQSDLPEQARQPWHIVAELLGQMEVAEA